MPPAASGVGGRLQLLRRKPSLGPEGRHPQAEERGVTDFRGSMPFWDAIATEHAPFDALVKLPQLQRRVRGPACCSEHRRLINHHVSDRMLADAVPIPVGKPAGAHHGPSLVCGPEAEHQAASELVAMSCEYASKLEHAGIAGGVIRRTFAIPTILMAANKDEVIPAAGRQLADRHLQIAPAVLDIGAQPHANRSLGKLIEEISSGGSGNAD